MRGRFNGAKIMYRSCDNKIVILFYWVGERSVSQRRYIVRYVGGIRSANADMSNDKTGEKLVRRNTKVSCPTLIEAGLADS